LKPEANRLDGKSFLVTGVTSGIGLETARALARRGGNVILGARDAARGRGVVDEIVGAGLAAELLEIDMASFSSVRRAAEQLTASHPRLDVLINNAGMVSRERRLSPDGHELTWATNFLGAFLLTQLLRPALSASPSPRVVNVSSEAHRVGRIDWNDLELAQGYGGFQAYANSKVALILFTRELARREPALAANAVHPGTIATNIWRAAPAWLRKIPMIFLPSAEKGAEPVVRLAAAADVQGVTGRYFDRFREATPSPAATNDADAARLWAVASEATGI
jgi:retinol dehydrogenase 12